ncbi:chromosome segregation protein Spc25-domain-containing protein [Mycena vitilis]|nr:chromosome segregation protein Spc25-domain-containing protein [Mycena vitilis]
MSHVVRVPQIDLYAVLSEQNPHIDLRVDSYEASTRNFLKAVANYKTRTIATIADKRATHAADKKRTTERIANIEAETNQCKVQEIQLVSDLQREQEERKEAEVGVAGFKKQLASLRDRCAAIDAQVEHYRAITSNLEREKNKERENLRSSAADSASESEYLESRLSCVVEGVGDGQLLVRMANIDQSNVSQEFSFVLDVSGGSYKVLTSSPSLATMPMLVAQLHESKDLPLFIKNVRQACVDMTLQAA